MGAAVRSFLLLSLACCLASSARAENNDCSQQPQPSHYMAQPGDTEDAQHLTLERTFAGGGRLELNVCSGELRVERGQGDHLKLRITTDTASGLKMRAYVKTLDVQQDHAIITLEFPRKLHPAVVLELPSSPSLRTEISLGAGTFFLDAVDIKGSRSVNVGAGTAHIIMPDDQSYARFQANVGIGSFHDHRLGGRNAHFVVSREYQGKGQGNLEVNVGVGHINVEPGKGQTL